MSDPGFRFGDWRMLDEFELAVLSQCMHAVDEDIRRLAEQALDLRVQMVRSERLWTLKFESSLGGPDKLFGKMVLLADDLDGEPIQVVMFHHHDAPVSLEFWRIDGRPIQDMPPASAFELA